MNEPKWTPGPWVMETVRTSCGLCHKVGPFPSPKSWQSEKPAHACIYDDYPPDGRSPELGANARLIAAAPDLYAALEMAQLWLDVDGRYDMQAINAALSKAKGPTT